MPALRGFSYFCLNVSNILITLNLHHLLPLRFHFVGGCWDRVQDSCNYRIGCQTPLTTRLALILMYKVRNGCKGMKLGICFRTSTLSLQNEPLMIFSRRPNSEVTTGLKLDNTFIKEFNVFLSFAKSIMLVRENFHLNFKVF
jgi:hypothetical protein